MALLDRIKNFFKDPLNVLLFLVVVLAFFLRLKYFNINSAVWWDEAEYLNIAKKWVFGVPVDISPLRPTFMSFIFAIFYWLGLGEFSIRLLILAFSMAGVILTYLIGKEMYNKTIGIIAAFGTSVFYLHLFYTGRILMGVPSLTMILLTIYFFWKGFVKNESKYYIWLTAISLVIAFLIRFTSGLLGVIILVFLLITERFNFLKDKNVWISAILGILISLPYFILTYIRYGNPFASVLASGLSATVRTKGAGTFETISYGIPQTLTYLQYFPIFMKPIFLILFIIGLITFVNLFLGFDLIFKGKEKRYHNDLFLLILFVVNIIYFGFFVNHFEDRYLDHIFPFVFLIVGVASLKIYNYLEKYNKYIAIITIILILAVGGYQQLNYAQNLIDLKANSYVQFKYAGEWLKERTDKDDIIVNAGVPQNTYYTERETIGYITEDNFNEKIKDGKIKYFVISKLEKSVDWMYTYANRNPKVLKLVYGCDNSICTDDLSKIDPNAISLVVYEVTTT